MKVEMHNTIVSFVVSSTQWHDVFVGRFKLEGSGYLKMNIMGEKKEPKAFYPEISHVLFHHNKQEKREELVTILKVSSKSFECFASILPL